jgi:hypothetical protein
MDSLTKGERMGNSNGSSSNSLVGTVLLFVVAIAMIGGGFYLYQDQQDVTDGTVEVEGTVLSTDIGEATREDENSPSNKRREVYYPQIEYQFTFEGQQYTSSNICPGAANTCDATERKDDISEVESFLADYPTGEQVPVYVPPDEPSEAYLEVGESGSSTGPLALMAFGGVMLVFGLIDVSSKLNN